MKPFLFYDSSRRPIPLKFGRTRIIIQKGGVMWGTFSIKFASAKVLHLLLFINNIVKYFS